MPPVASWTKPDRPDSRAPIPTVTTPSTVAVEPSGRPRAVGDPDRRRRRASASAWGSASGRGRRRRRRGGRRRGRRSGSASAWGSASAVGVGLGASGAGVGVGVAVGPGVGLALGLVVGAGVALADGGGDGDGTGGAPSPCGCGAAWTTQSDALSFVSRTFPPVPPGSRSMLDPAGGAAAGLPSTNAFAASPQPTASIAVPPIGRMTRAPPVAARPPRVGRVGKPGESARSVGDEQVSPGIERQGGRPGRLAGHRRARRGHVGELEPGEVHGTRAGVRELDVLVGGRRPAGHDLGEEDRARRRPRDRGKRRGDRPHRARDAGGAVERESDTAPTATDPRDTTRTRAAIAARRARAIDNLPAGRVAGGAPVVPGAPHRPLTRGSPRTHPGPRLRCRPTSAPSPSGHPQSSAVQRRSPTRPDPGGTVARAKKTDRAEARRRARAAAAEAAAAAAEPPPESSTQPATGGGTDPGGRVGPAGRPGRLPRRRPADRPPGRHRADPVARHQDVRGLAAEPARRRLDAPVRAGRRDDAGHPGPCVQPVRVPAADGDGVPGRGPRPIG